ncbi:hypothetical protein NQ315_001518 [Exocentrus adspersus]|uniref:Chitin-binding type-2 domain-containing protein n=1 Tax=Exocentrus adspersus TaxID=1586481 RepID=A0AAV8W9W8_9CUCU|nr:hypothetical protein NQ315_001518 [Exocentrus adspersus]
MVNKGVINRPEINKEAKIKAEISKPDKVKVVINRLEINKAVKIKAVISKADNKVEISKVVKMGNKEVKEGRMVNKGIINRPEINKEAKIKAEISKPDKVKVVINRLEINKAVISKADNKEEISKVVKMGNKEVKEAKIKVDNKVEISKVKMGNKVVNKEAKVVNKVKIRVVISKADNKVEINKVKMDSKVAINRAAVNKEAKDKVVNNQTKIKVETSKADKVPITKTATRKDKAAIIRLGSSWNSTNVSSGIGTSCSTEGYLGDPNDCKKFYRCVNAGNNVYTRYEFNCGRGTVWDANSITCNYPWAVRGKCSQVVEPPEPSTTTEQSGAGSTPQGTTSSGTTEPGSTTGSGGPESTTSTDGSGGSTQPTDSSASTTGWSSTNTPTGGTGESSTPASTIGSTIPLVETTTSGWSTTPTSGTTDLSSTPGSTDATSTLGSTEATSTLGTTDGTVTVGTVGSTTQLSTTPDSGYTSTTQSGTDGTTQGGAGTTEPPTTMEPCPIGQLEGDQIALVCPTGFRRHPKYCNLFYQCTKRNNDHDYKILVLSCPEGTIYDNNKIQCLPQNETQACAGEIATSRLYRWLDDNSLPPVQITSRRPLCPLEGFHGAEENECSTNFIRCQSNSVGRLEGYMYQCPQEFAFWKISRRCERMSRLFTCRGGDIYRTRWEIPVETDNVSYRRRKSANIDF